MFGRFIPLGLKLPTTRVLSQSTRRTLTTSNFIKSYNRNSLSRSLFTATKHTCGKCTNGQKVRQQLEYVKELLNFPFFLFLLVFDSSDTPSILKT